jgi:hypothetical protein
MTRKTSKPSGAHKSKKLRVKKETLKDLDAARGKGPRGGLYLRTAACAGGGGGGVTGNFTYCNATCACQQRTTVC